MLKFLSPVCGVFRGMLLISSFCPCQNISFFIRKKIEKLPNIAQKSLNVSKKEVFRGFSHIPYHSHYTLPYKGMLMIAVRITLRVLCLLSLLSNFVVSITEVHSLTPKVSCCTFTFLSSISPRENSGST